MITCLSQIAYKYEDYSMLTSDKVISSLQLHLERQVSSHLELIIWWGIYPYVSII